MICGRTVFWATMAGCAAILASAYIAPARSMDLSGEAPSDHVQDGRNGLKIIEWPVVVDGVPVKVVIITDNQQSTVVCTIPYSYQTHNVDKYCVDLSHRYNKIVTIGEPK